MLISTMRRALVAACTLGLLAGISGVASAQNALADIEKNKLIRIAIPTDFPPYGFVGPDLKPQGLDVDMANLIAQKMGVKVELVVVTSANRIPYLQTRRADLVISTLGKKTFGDLAGKSVAVTRGAMEDQELSKVAPATADVKRFEDNNATVSAYVSGQVNAIATGISVAENMMQRNPQQGTEFKLLLKDSPNFIGVAKGEDALRMKVNEIIAAAVASGEIDKMSQKWLKRPAGDLPK